MYPVEQWGLKLFRVFFNPKEVYKIKYKVAKKLAKKAVMLVKEHAFERLYKKLETNKGEKDAFKLASTREKRNRDLTLDASKV